MIDPVRHVALEILLHLDQSNQTLDACLEERVTETLFPLQTGPQFYLRPGLWGVASSGPSGLALVLLQ